MANLIQRIRKRDVELGVVGLGYVGLPLAVEKARAGFRVVGFDVQEQKVAWVNQGHNYIGDVVDDDLSRVVTQGRLRATTDFASVASCDCVCIAVPTPLDAHREPDLSFVRDSARSILPYLHRDMLVVLESTTYPGTTEELIKPILEESGLRCGTDFYLAFSPERVDPGNKRYQTRNTPKVVGGVTPACTDAAAALYESVLEAPVHRVSSPAVAEMEKLLENVYRNVNIGLVNEMAMLCDRMGVNVWEVIDAAKTKPYGFQPFYPGPGIGGHCIPLEPYYLSWKAREYGFHSAMLEGGMMINDRMPEYCAQRAMRLLNEHRLPMNGSRLLLLGVAYKQDVGDTRESPALRVMDALRALGASVDYYDPYVPSCVHGGVTYTSLPALTPDALSGYDLVVVTTMHECVDYEMVAEHARLVLDTKNATRDVADRSRIRLL